MQLVAALLGVATACLRFKRQAAHAGCPCCCSRVPRDKRARHMHAPTLATSSLPLPPQLARKSEHLCGVPFPALNILRPPCTAQLRRRARPGVSELSWPNRASQMVQAGTAAGTYLNQHMDPPSCPPQYEK